MLGLVNFYNILSSILFIQLVKIATKFIYAISFGNNIVYIVIKTNFDYKSLIRIISINF